MEKPSHESAQSNNMIGRPADYSGKFQSVSEDTGTTSHDNFTSPLPVSEPPIVKPPISEESEESGNDVQMEIDEEEREDDKPSFVEEDHDVDMDQSSEEEISSEGEKEEEDSSEDSIDEEDEESSEEEDAEDDTAPRMQEPADARSQADIQILELGNVDSVARETSKETNFPPAASQLGNIVEQAVVTPAKANIASNVFIPYRSPLMDFKSFRYHPRYLDFVPGGYRSNTYSNRIDPKKTMCLYEFNGGKCNDLSCTSQHWRQIEIPDDEILVELASVTEGQSEETKKQYNKGLRQEIGKMRELGIKDFQTVVLGISEYRRRFLEDDTRILRLP
ncbi:hypothetical protein RUND412_002584 [Rhizina undulata]